MQKAPQARQNGRGTDTGSGRGDRALVVSIHDVSPLTAGTVRRMLADLGKIGLDSTSLLVIPDHHRRGLVSEDREFAGWLRECHGDGQEIVLHGYCHLRDPVADEGLWKKLVTGTYTAGEGEFYDLGEAEAAARLEAGRRALEACGLSAGGFIAPAWLLGEDAERAVRAAGFEYTTRIATVSDFRSGVVHRSRSLVWSVRAGWRRACSLVWNWLVFTGTAEDPLQRIGLHPPDWEHPAIRAQILEFVAKALARRKAMTYGSWVQSVRGGKFRTCPDPRNPPR